eukprot:TRINITY_DN983_c0_g1_i1.p1 TRINITY_DN983_c0_g1~~TRINITY_DN983_c0_g1_i1.p1  ORF type:complete len:244 (-),score=50.75 TRINITY_DN983_c0_g1_i1:955-1686(-)
MAGVTNIFGRLLQRAGQSIESVGCRLQGHQVFAERLGSRRVQSLREFVPSISPTAHVPFTSTAIGGVTIGDGTFLGVGSQLRGDVQDIEIGRNTSIGDGVVIHVAKYNSQEFVSPTKIGNFITVESGAILHACTLEDQCVVEAGAIVLDGAVVRTQAIVGAGSLVSPGTEVKAGQLWAGSPAKFVRDLTPEERKALKPRAQNNLEVQHDLMKSHQDVTEFVELGQSVDPNWEQNFTEFRTKLI